MRVALSNDVNLGSADIHVTRVTSLSAPHNLDFTPAQEVAFQFVVLNFGESFGLSVTIG